MASRKEQKEQLRRERQEREAEAKAAQRRKQMIGYGAGGLAVAVIVVVAVVLLAGGGGGGGGEGESSASSDVLPGGGSVPEQKITELGPAAKAAGCTLQNFKGKSREHTADPNEAIKYDSNPPTEGKHFQEPAADDAYDEAPDIKSLVHTLEHGRIIMWFNKGAPKDERADLKALYDKDSYQMVLTPDPKKMKYAFAASAWSREPVPNGTGRLLACPKWEGDKTLDAIQAFRDEHRGNGPEPIP